MADPYLDKLLAVIHDIRDLHEAAALLNLPFEVVCHTFNNGLLKGYWRIVTHEKLDAQPRMGA